MLANLALDRPNVRIAAVLSDGRPYSHFRTAPKPPMRTYFLSRCRQKL